MTKVFISTPMKDKTDKEIQYCITAAMDDIERLIPGSISFVHNYIPSEDEFTKPLYLLGRAFQKMSECDAVYFTPGWEEARGCMMEYRAAKAYGLKIIGMEANLNG